MIMVLQLSDALSRTKRREVRVAYDTTLEGVSRISYDCSAVHWMAVFSEYT